MNISVTQGEFCEQSKSLLALAVLDDYIAGADPSVPNEVELEVERYIQDTLDEGVGYIVKLMDSNRLIGLALPRKPCPLTMRMFASFIKPDCLRLGIIYVHPDYRAKGLSSMIVQYCQNLFDNLIWQCCPTNVASSSLALSQGFRHVEITTKSNVVYTAYVWDKS